MARKLRVEYPGAIYHLIQRGNNRSFIFKEKEDKTYLLNLIQDYKKTMNFEVYGYVIMGNHYHLIIQITEPPLHSIMHGINWKFSRHYNLKNERTGHVFENRYTGIWVQDERYLLSLLRYIHQNPVRAKLCENVGDYSWSSDFYYRENNQDGIVNIDAILSMFSNNRAEAVMAYHDFVGTYDNKDLEILGKVDCKNTTNDMNDRLDITARMIPQEKNSLDQILRKVTQDEEIMEKIKENSRKRYLSPYKKQFIQVAMEEEYSIKDIASYLAISPIAIFKTTKS